MLAWMRSGMVANLSFLVKQIFEVPIPAPVFAMCLIGTGAVGLSGNN